jgi:hypothetical protein
MASLGVEQEEGTPDAMLRATTPVSAEVVRLTPAPQNEQSTESPFALPEATT